ncbi:MAG: substrate-binding domain-containing protein, partial [Actinomycetota bacterium]|nr:substrate-binding domain-containing protein [Actinomycetota bacterium]
RAQSGSDGVANFVAEPFNNGAITYVEYGYALNRSFPVVSVLNQAGYFVQPTAENVAVALGRARINSDRTQNLHDVYTNPDPRTYPVSSYSYMIVPTTTAPPFTAEKGKTLSKFILYIACAGQQEAALLGYSPIPKNLVQADFDVVRRIPGHVEPPPIDQCNNPTITGSFVTQNAPPPPPGDRQGSAPPAQSGGATTGSVAQSSGNLNGNASNARTGRSATGKTSAASKSALGKTGANTAKAGAGQSTDAALDPGLVLASGPTSVPAARDPLPLLLYVVAGAVALLAIFAPPALALQLRRRRSHSSPSSTE